MVKTERQRPVKSEHARMEDTEEELNGFLRFLARSEIAIQIVAFNAGHGDKRLADRQKYTLTTELSSLFIGVIRNRAILIRDDLENERRQSESFE